jgi:U3 small nucleolar RNA-associated protein 22
MPIDMARLATASTFTLEADELLKEVQLDYDESFGDAIDLLRDLRAVIDDIEPHDPIPVWRASSNFPPNHSN